MLLRNTVEPWRLIQTPLTRVWIFPRQHRTHVLTNWTTYLHLEILLISCTRLTPIKAPCFNAFPEILDITDSQESDG